MAPKHDDTETILHSAMNQAIENGYEDWFMGMSDEDIAIDLCSQTKVFSGADHADLVPFVTSWRATQTGKLAPK